MNRFIASLSSGSQYSAAALLALLGTRFAYFALGAMLAGGADDDAAGKGAQDPSTFKKALEEAREAAKAHDRKKADEIVGRKKADPKPKKPGDPGGRLVVTLSVSLGPPRSEVYANGKFLGKTPYVGSYTCRGDRPIKLQILPIEGPMIEVERACRGRMVTVKEEANADLDEPTEP